VATSNTGSSISCAVTSCRDARGGRIRPLEVLEDDGEALLLPGATQDVGDLQRLREADGPAPAGRVGGDELGAARERGQRAEDLQPGPERWAALGLDAAADGDPGRPGPAEQFVHQPGLAVPGFAGDEDELSDAGSGARQRIEQGAELLLTSDERGSGRDRLGAGRGLGLGRQRGSGRVDASAGPVGPVGPVGPGIGVRSPPGGRSRGSCRRIAASSSCRAGEGSMPSSSASIARPSRARARASA
jgi:hypothetical protein